MAWKINFTQDKSKKGRYTASCNIFDKINRILSMSFQKKKELFYLKNIVFKVLTIFSSVNGSRKFKCIVNNFFLAL